ncbi:hypothetical protein DSECCO2_457700 [anaerobic digester metagenome]
MNKTNKNEIPGFRNYDKWMEGYDVLHNWLQDSLERIQNNKPHNMSKEERNEIINNVAFSLVKGAVALQFVGDQDFYLQSEDEDDIEILIKFKKSYNSMKKDEIVFNLMKDIILALEREKHQFERIAATYDNK